MSKTLDLGSGRTPKNPFGADDVYGVDVTEFGVANVKVADLAIDPIPFAGNTFEFVTGFDFLEHIPRVLYLGRHRRQPFIDVMNEVWRVLRPDGIALFATPALPHAETFQDPQHVNYITERTILYFCRPNSATGMASALEFGRQYGFKGTFELIEQGWRKEVPYHLIWKLKAIK